MKELGRFYRVTRISHRLCFLLLLLLSISPSTLRAQAPIQEPLRSLSQDATQGSPHERRDLDFRLRHVYHRSTIRGSDLHRRLDIAPDETLSDNKDAALGTFRIRSAPIHIDRPVNGELYTSDSSFEAWLYSSQQWKSEPVTGPDVIDKSTVINLAWTADDAYKPDASDPGWTDIGQGFNSSLDFGWEEKGLQGHVFTDESNSTIIIAIKGTTRAVYDGPGTEKNDKENDNLFGSCCCGQGGPYLWRQVCDCMTSTYTCNATCVKSSFREPNRYYQASLELYGNITQVYPNSSVILVGHSLGGVMASLMGLTFGQPSVTFEAYPQALAANRLDLPVSPAAYYGLGAPIRKNTGGFHFGHTADPVYMGTCNGASSFCSLAGYAFESLCHTGQRCVYDVVNDWGWRQSVRYHSIRYAIENIYSQYDRAAPCVPEDEDCVDCFLWKFYESNGTEPTSRTSTRMPTTSFTKTRTATCKTPGWWRCRDKSTTTCTSTATSQTSATATCTHYGWFGRCLDPTSTTSTSLPPTALMPHFTPSITSTHRPQIK